MKHLISSFLFIGLASTSGFAQSAQQGSSALTDTQELLKSKSKRQEVFNKDAKAKAANDQVINLTGGDDAKTQEMYNISSEAFASLMQAAGNDPNKAMELLQQAQANPEAFYQSLPKDVRAKIQGVASDIEKKNAPKNNP